MLYVLDTADLNAIRHCNEYYPLAGCHSVTINESILKRVISHPMTDAAIAGFDKDRTSVYSDKTILDF